MLGAKKFPTQAIEASRKAVELMPDAYRYREALAKRLMENQEYEDALTEYTEAEKLAPNAFFAEQMGDQRIEIYRRQGTLLDEIGTVEEQLKNKRTMLRKLSHCRCALPRCTSSWGTYLRA